MNFCQKHQNHHCIHAHSCKDPSHQRHISKQTTSKLNKTDNNQHNHQHKHKNHNNQECIFIKNINNKDRKDINNELLQLLHQKQLKICQLEHRDTQSKIKNQKLFEENKHLYTQIQYYRQQFTNLIGNNNHDNKNQIKKHLKQSTNLHLKISSLQNQNQNLSNQNQRLKNELHFINFSKIQNKNLNENLQQKYTQLHNKLKLLSKQKEEYKQQLQKQIKEYSRLKQNYEILKKQYNFDCQKGKKQIKELNIELQILKKELNKYRNTHDRQKQFYLLEINSQQKKQEALKTKLESYEINNKQLFHTIKQLKDKNQILEQDLYHAKKIIDRNQQNTHQLITLQRDLNQKNVETNTIIKDHHSCQGYSSNKQNKIPSVNDYKSMGSDNQVVLKLKEEIERLNIKIGQLQKRNISHFEEVILNMGASQAFKKLLDEKNTVIKKLIRQKGEIYTKITLQQH